MNKKTPVIRMCIVSRKKFLKEELFRVVKTDDGIYLDINQDVKGRGVYIKKDLSTIMEGQKKNSLSRGLRCPVDDSIYLELIQALSKERR